MSKEDIKLLHGVLATLYFVRACKVVGSDDSDEVVNEYIDKLNKRLIEIRKEK